MEWVYRISLDKNEKIAKYKKADKNSVDNISFSFKEGEFVAFLGPNGAGKTTTISILNTILSKTSGDVKVAEFDVEKEQSLVRKNIGIIFQNPSLDLKLTAEEKLTDHYVLIQAENPELLSKELDQLNIEYKKVDQGYQLALDQTQTIQKIFQMIKRPLINIKVFQPSLEEAYIQILNNN